MTNGNFTKTTVENGDGEELLPTEELLVHPRKVIKTRAIA